MSLLCAAAVVLATGTIGDAQASEFEAGDETDPDLRLVNTHFGLHLGSHVATAGFGVGSLVVGIEYFSLYATSQGGTQSFFLGLTLVSLGAASLINSITGIDGSVKRWKRLRRSFAGASAAERRLLREQEAARLRQRASNRALGLAADGTFLGIGIALMVVSPSGLGLPLVVNGAFLLALDIFRLVVDDQAARKWSLRERDADAGYFGARHRTRQPIALGGVVVPLLAPPGSGSGAPGGLLFALSGRY